MMDELIILTPQAAFRFDVESGCIETCSVIFANSEATIVKDWHEIDWLHAADQEQFTTIEAMFAAAREAA